MSVLAKPHTFSANTTISSSQMNSNFDTLYNDYNGGIAAVNLATDAVTTAKIADLNVTAGKLASNAVTTAKVTDDAVTSAKLEYGLVRNRQGGASGDASWQTAGTTTTATDAKSVFTQAGAVDGNAASDVTVTFPSAFNQVPIVVACVCSASTANCYVVVATESATNFTFRCIDAGGIQRAERVNWFAIGQ